MPGYQVKALLTGIRLCCGWGVTCLRFRALAGSWSRILGAACPVGHIPHPIQGFPSSPRSHPDIVSDTGWLSSVSGLVPGGLGGVVLGCLRNPFRSGFRLIQSSFPSIREEDFLAPVALSVACLLYPLFKISGRFLWLCRLQ